MITMRDFWMHRDSMYPLQLSTDIKANAERTVNLVNTLLERAAAAGIYPSNGAAGYGCVNSGWRPQAVNSQTPGAAKNSKHMDGLAIDVADDDGELDNWLMTTDGQAALVEIGLWMEHPSATKGWCHLQSMPPKSGNRTFYP